VFEIGNSLREARLRRQMEFAEAEHGTKIRGKYLRALEDERFELLPSHTYVKGFLRSYAEYLGLDGQLYVDEYNSRYVTSGEDDAPMRATRRVPAAKARRSERRESNIVLLALTAIGVVTALVIVAWRFGGVEGDPVRGLTTSQPQQQTPTPQAAGTARLELRATRGDSYMIVRSGSSQGEGNVLYKGTLERNQKQRFDSRVLWLSLEKPENVLVKLNGNRVTLPKKAVKAQGVFVTAKRVFAADAS
jgi:cytoskeletal protein RodZ